MAESNDELETLRRTNAELLTKSATRKQKIAELEKANTELQSQLGEANASLRRITVDAPLTHLAESMSNVPDLFIEQLSKHFKVELVEGNLTLLTTEGKPIFDKNGKSVSLKDQKALSDYLTDGDSARAKTFRLITIASRASGGAVPPQKLTPKLSKPSMQKFGLASR